MSDAFPQAAAVDSYNNDILKFQNNLDFFSFLSPVEVVAPHPDLFESDIDSNLAAFTDQLQLFTVDSNDAYNFFRTEKPHWQGPLSTITVSSDSCDTISNHSESFYNEPISNTDTALFDFSELDMDFQRVSVGSDYATVSSLGMIDDSADHSAYAPLSPAPSTSPPSVMNVPKVFEKGYPTHRSFSSDYGHPRRKVFATSSDYYPSMGYPQSHPTVSPSHISTQLPTIGVVPPPPIEETKDPRKKYKCTACPRAFARAFNLKTHMATHDPNRLKPYVCPQRSCGRSFSRKHDLGRHLISIHRDEAISSSLLPGSKKAIGVESGTRSWCDTCGKGYVGRNNGCHCTDVK